VKKKRRTDKDGNTGHSDKDKKPRATDAAKKADDTSTSTVQEPSPHKCTKQKATSDESALIKNPAAANETTGVAPHEKARTNPVTAPQAQPIPTGAEKTESSGKPAPAPIATKEAAPRTDNPQAPSPTDEAQAPATSSPVASAANKPKKSPLPHTTKKTSPLSLFTQATLHDDHLLSVTSAEDWTAKTNNMTKGEKEELTNRMAAFILSLEEVNVFVPDTLLPNPTELQSYLRHLIATSHRIATMKDFVQPYAVTHASGKGPAGFYGKGLNAFVDLLDKQISAITLWKHLRGALSDYYHFIVKSPKYQWHALAMAIMATLTVYQVMVNRVPKFFPGIVTPDIDSIVEARKTASGSLGAGSSRSATTSKKDDATDSTNPATRSGGSGHTPAA
jgi:hypothetical protein